MKPIIALFLLSVAVSLSAQPRRQASTLERMAMMPFNDAPLRFDVVTFAGKTPDSVRTDIYIAVPYTMLEFLHTRDAYIADYAINVTLNDAATAITDRYYSYHVTESAGEHDTRVEKKLSRADAQQISLMLRPAVNYELHLVFHDLHIRSELDTTFHIHIGDFRSLQPAMSDMLLYRSRRGNRIIPAIGGDDGELDPDHAGAFAEAYHLHADSNYGLVTTIKHVPMSGESVSDESAVTVKSIVKASSNTTPIFQPIPFNELWAGRYMLTMYLLDHVSDTALALSDLSHKAIASSERQIIVRMSHGIPLASGDLNEAIEQLRLIATAFEWDSLDRAKTVTEKRDAIVEFWRKRDLDAMQRTTERDGPMKIFYARIEYANVHFQYGFVPGWKSDRGRLYVALGPPDNIEKHSYEANEKPYEIWEYYRPSHTRYIFVDPYLLGDFRLNGAMPPEGTFVWDENE